jgi:hypothetical protein
MSSFNQNRINAQSSTGPRTPEGKAASSRNAVKHGLSAKFVPLSDEERPQFEQLEADLRDQVKPRGPLQEIIFRELLLAAWKRDVVNTLLFEASQSTRGLFADEASDRVRKLQRHKADQDRAFKSAMRQLTELQTSERIRATTLIAIEDRNPGADVRGWAEGLADFTKITKQSQLVHKLYPKPAGQQVKALQSELTEMLSKFKIPA